MAMKSIDLCRVETDGTRPTRYMADDIEISREEYWRLSNEAEVTECMYTTTCGDEVTHCKTVRVEG